MNSQNIKQIKKIKRKLNGVLLLDKPKNISSNNALQQVRRLFNAEKAGHTGNLDPIATGLLPICFGEATKFAQYLLDSDKAYRAVVQLGKTTTTGDTEGETLQTYIIPTDLTEDHIKHALQNQLGEQEQIPPMYSALKFQGKPLYEYARQDIEIERKARTIHIYKIDFLEYNPIEHQITIDVYCSKGTYIRVLCESIGQALNCGAYMQELRRLESGGFLLSQAYPIETFQNKSIDEIDGYLLPIDCLLSHFESINLNDEQHKAFQLGQSIAIEYHHEIYKNFDFNQLVKIYNENTRLFLGLAQLKIIGEETSRKILIFPKRVVVFSQ